MRTTSTGPGPVWGGRCHVDRRCTRRPGRAQPPPRASGFLSYPLRSVRHMAIFDDYEERISPRLADALVADLIIAGEEDDERVRDRRRRFEERAWTDDLARQLGMRRDATYAVPGLHTTLLFLVRVLDDHVRHWPPGTDHTQIQPLAHSATQDLTPVETVGMLATGPREWRSVTVDEGCRVDRLGAHLQPALERGLISRLTEMLARWVEWDIRQLRDRGRRTAEASEEPLVKKRIPARKPPKRPPEERHKDHEGFFTPPGRP